MVTLSQKQLQRLRVIEKAVEGRLSVREAAPLLELSERQVQRLKRRFQPGSADWLSHGNCGLAKPWALSADWRQRVLDLARSRYAGFNDSHLHEKLVAEEGFPFTRECLRAAGSEEFAHRRFAELSGGQKQRVLIARALTTRPNVLVLDEPTAGVDREAKDLVLKSISQIHKEKKITVLLVTHDFAAVRHYAEQVIWLYEGKISNGATHELLTAERMAKIFETGMA